MDTQQTHVPRDRGARNDGSKYETQVMTLLASRWLKDDTIKDFWMVTSPMGIKSFDDIVAVLTNADGSKEVLMGQIKHSHKTMNLKFSNEKSKQHLLDIRLDKYLESYNDIRTQNAMNEDLRIVLAGIPQEKHHFFIFTSMEATEELTKASINGNDPLGRLDVKSRCYFQWVQDVPENYHEFFKRLYFFTGQDNSVDIYKALQENIPGDRFTDPMIDCLCDFIDDYMSNGDYCLPLTKSIFWDKCVEVCLGQKMRVEPIEVRLKEEHLQMWDEIFSNYTVIKLDEVNSVLSIIHSYFEFKIKTLHDGLFNWNECLENGRKVNVKITTFANKEKQINHLLDLLRFMANRKEIPWLVEEEHRQLLYEFKNSFSNGRFLIAFDASWIKGGRRTFSNANDLKERSHIFKGIETIQVSLQGKSTRPLKDIVGDSVDILKSVRPFHLLKWTSTDLRNGTIGNRLEKTDEDYIIRKFSKSSLFNTKFQTEEQLIANLKSQILTVISNDPGMGKSTALKSLARKTNPTNYVVCWNLAKSMADLDSDNPNLYNDPLNYFFSKSETNPDQLVKTVFENHRDSSRVTALIDSYDEMLPLYGEKILDILNVILKHKIRVVITTRTHAEPLLKNRFPYLDLVYLTQFSDTEVEDYCKKCNIPYKLQYSFARDFLKIPLHLSMIRLVRDNNENIRNVTSCELYEYFIHEKLDIYFSKNSTSKNLRATQVKSFLETHMQLALFHMFQKNPLMKDNKIIGDEKWDEIIESSAAYNAIGIVSVLESKQVQFAHQTYAEYLSARWMVKNMKKSAGFSKMAMKDSYGYQQTLKFLIELNLKAKENTSNSSLVLEEDEWGLLPLHWGALSFYIDEKNASILENLLTETLKTVSDTNSFIMKYISDSECSSSQLWLKYVCDVDRDDLLEYLLRTFHPNSRLAIRYHYDYNVDLLQYCCIKQYKSKIEILLNKGADPNQPDDLGKTSLHLACFEGNKDIVQLLLDKKADPNVLDKKSMNSLHYACSNKNNLDVVQLLLKHNSNPNQRGNDGRTTLDLACVEGSKDVVKLLLDSKVNPNLVDSNGETALHKACSKGDNIDVIELLLQHKANPDQQRNDGVTSLHVATDFEDADLVKLLLHNNADPNIVDVNGENTLHRACSKQNALDIVALLLAYKSDPNQQRNDGATCLHVACDTCNRIIVQLLLNSDADPNIIDNKGENALFRACCKGYNIIVELLLQSKSNPNQQTNDGKTSLHLACDMENTFSVQLLLNNKANPNLVDNDGENALYKACCKNNFSIVQLLLQHKANPNQQRNDGASSLHAACEVGNRDIVELLLDTNADLNMIDHTGQNGLHYACVKKDNLPIVQLLLERKLDPNQQSNDGMTGLHLACVEGQIDIVQFLIDNKADTNLKGQKIMNALHYACANEDNLELVRLLLQHKLDPNQPRDGGATSLHLACWKTNEDIVQLLLNNNADPNLEDSTGANSLHYASSNKHGSGIVRLLLKRKLDPSYSESDQRTSFHLAAFYGNKDIVQIFLDHGADTNLVGDEGMTVLHYACLDNYSDNVDVVRLLLQHKLNPNQPMSDGRTSLHVASVTGNEEMVRILLDSNGDINLVDNDGMTSLHYACLGEDNLDIVELLLQRKLDPNKSTERGKTSLHLACREGKKNIVQLLLNNDADPNLVDTEGQNSLHFLLSSTSGNMDILKVLLEYNVDVNRRRNDGSTSLHLACEKGYKDIVTLLLDRKTDPNLRRNDGLNCFEIAFRKGHSDILKILSPHLQKS